MPDMVAQVAANVAAIRQRIDEASRRSGRRGEDVTLVAVTKYVGIPQIRAVAAAGVREVAESRPQHLWERAEELAALDLRWHMIGHLQRNKVRRTLPCVTLLHSVDSVRLAAAVDEAAAEIGRPASVLLEVNVSGEENKQGFAPAELEGAIGEIFAFGRLEVGGLMCMAGLEGDLDDARREFASLRELRDRLQPLCPSGVILKELSMGMSGDFEAAIEEGATLVRIGSALFEGLES